MFSDLEQQVAEVHVRARAARVEPQALAQRRLRVVEPAAHEQRGAELRVRVRAPARRERRAHVLRLSENTRALAESARANPRAFLFSLT